jgi:hypothetical protein
MATQSGRSLFGAFDRIVNSPANYWVAMLCDLAAALAFMVLVPLDSPVPLWSPAA